MTTFRCFLSILLVCYDQLQRNTIIIVPIPVIGHGRRNIDMIRYRWSSGSNIRDCSVEYTVKRNDEACYHPTATRCQARCTHACVASSRFSEIVPIDPQESRMRASVYNLSKQRAVILQHWECTLIWFNYINTYQIISTMSSLI